MSKIISMFAALVLGAVACAADAATWKPFLHGVNSPSELADKIQASNEKNPKGDSMLDPVRCKTDGSCATPLNYLEALQQADPLSGLKNVSQLPEYLRSLQVVDAPSGEYWMACLKPEKPGGSGPYHAAIHCLSRIFKKGEKAWIDPQTKRIVFASDCTNPVEKPVKEECVYIPFTVTARETVSRFGLLGSAAVKEDDDCLGLKRVGETEFERWWKDECAVVGCDFSADAKVVGQPVQIFGSIWLLAPGEYVLRLPAYVAEKSSTYVTVLCFERGDAGPAPKEPRRPTPDMDATTYREAYTVYMAFIDEYKLWRAQWLASHSDGRGVRWQDYRVAASGRREARVYYTLADVPADMPKLYITWGEWVKAHPEALE